MDLGAALRGIRRQVAKDRRASRSDQEELVPLALSSDSDVMGDVIKEDKDDVFADSHANGVAHKVKGDKEKWESGDAEFETRCGFVSCRPEALQRCNNPKALLLFLCFFSMAQGFVVNGINNVNTSTVERRFHLPSSRVGMISSSYDLSAAILGVFISFMGSGRHKAKWLAVASVVMGIGSFVMALPHFTTGLYQWGQDVALACNTEADSPVVCSSDSHLQNYLYVLVLGQLLHGLGGTTLYTVGVGLIDDSVPATSSPLYIGIMYAFAALGPALGYIVGGQLLSVFVDFDKVSQDQVRIEPTDPRWVGAWWLGFLMASGFFLVAAIPISLYGSELPSAKEVREKRVSEMHGDDGTMAISVSEKSRSLKDLRYLPLGLWRLVTIPPFIFITFAGATEGLITSGFATFMPKFIQNQFGVTAGWASMLTGFVAVPGAAGGQFFGGYLCKRLGLRVRGCIRVGIVACTIALVMSVALWTKCGIGSVAGVNSPYHGSEAMAAGEFSLVSPCNADCRCHTELYEPVCDEQGKQYFSPCHAGCRHQGDDEQSYTNCSCVPTRPGQNVSMVTVGKCASDCKLLYVYLPLLFIIIFATFVTSAPAVSATLRCIHDSQRTLGMGAKWFIVRLLGTVPGPILFGAIIDGTCVLWREKCGDDASCWIYDNNQMSRNFFLLCICVKLLSIVFFSLAHFVYKPPAEKGMQYVVEQNINRTESVSSAMTDIVDRHDRNTSL